MSLGLAGRNVPITGGSRAIGFACAQALLDEGANVALVAPASHVTGAQVTVDGASHPSVA